MQGRSNRRLAEAVGAVAVLATAGMMTAPMALADSSASRIKNCADSDWCSYHRTVDKAWRYSPLAQINQDNIGNLHVAWIFQPGESIQGLHSTPLVVDGAMYISTNPSLVWKLDAATGKRIWGYKPDMDPSIVSRTFFPHTRGLSIGDGRVYIGQADGYLTALDDATGDVVWSKQLVDSAKETAGFSGAGTFVSSDLFVIGQNGGEYPVEGKIFGVDPKTGDLKWTFYTTGRDDPKALATWGGDS
jgi:glucose dehydrogenase